VAQGARLGETLSAVVRVGRTVEILRVTGVAVGWSTCIPASDMALDAGDRCMGSGQRERGRTVAER
jgi:hypothetical protein